MKEASKGERGANAGLRRLLQVAKVSVLPCAAGAMLQLKEPTKGRHGAISCCCTGVWLFARQVTCNTKPIILLVPSGNEGMVPANPLKETNSAMVFWSGSFHFSFPVYRTSNLGGDSPLFSTIVLLKNRLFPLGF